MSRLGHAEWEKMVSTIVDIPTVQNAHTATDFQLVDWSLVTRVSC